MIKANFTYNPDNTDYIAYLSDQYKKVSQAIAASEDFELSTSFNYLGITSIIDFNEHTWEPLGLASGLGPKEEAMLAIVEPSIRKEVTQAEVLDGILSLLMKRFTILKLQPYLLIAPNQSDVEELDKLVRLKIEFN